MMKRRAFLGSIVGGSLALARLGRVQAEDGEPEDLFIDCQAWWTAVGSPVPGHFHIAADMPVRQSLHGDVEMDLRLEAFNQPPGTRWMTLQARITGLPMQNVQPPDNWPWAVGVAPGGHVSREVAITFSTLHPDENSRRDGWVVLTLVGTVKRFDGTMVLHTSIPVYLSNGYPVQGPVMGQPWCGAGGWFIDREGNHGYPDARLYQKSEREARAGVPALWRLVIGGVSRRTPPVRMRVCVNPAFHDLSKFPAGDPGIVIYDGLPANRMAVTIDTSPLPRGWNRLFVQTAEHHFSTGSSAGVAVYRFWVP